VPQADTGGLQLDILESSPGGSWGPPGIFVATRRDILSQILLADADRTSPQSESVRRDLSRFYQGVGGLLRDVQPLGDFRDSVHRHFGCLLLHAIWLGFCDRPMAGADCILGFASAPIAADDPPTLGCRVKVR